MRKNSFVFLNGSLIRESEAKVSIFDRGFMYGDGLFETLRSYNGRLFMSDAHIERLRRSAQALGIPFKADPRRLAQAVERLVLLNGFARKDCAVRIILTRGAGPLSLFPPARCSPTLVAVTRPLDRSLARLQRNGVALVFSKSTAPGRELASHKTLDYLPAILAKKHARACGAYEAIYLGRGNQVLEGATSNIFAVTRDTLLTPPTRDILPGITRGLVLDLARAVGMRTRQARLTREQLENSDEIFITASTVEILPVVRLEGRGLRAGLTTRRLQKLYRQRVKQLTKA